MRKYLAAFLVILFTGLHGLVAAGGTFARHSAPPAHSVGVDVVIAVHQRTAPSPASMNCCAKRAAAGHFAGVYCVLDCVVPLSAMRILPGSRQASGETGNGELRRFDLSASVFRPPILAS